MRALLLMALLASGCSKIFGFDDPKLRDDAGVGIDAGIDAPGDGGADIVPITIQGFTSVGPAASTGNVQVLDPRFEVGQTVCSADNKICIRGGLTP